MLAVPPSVAATLFGVGCSSSVFAEAIADDMRVSISCGACSEVRPIPLAEIPQTGKTYDHDCAAGQALALRGMHLFAALSESAGSASGSIEEQLMFALGGKRTILGKALTDHLVHVMAGAELSFVRITHGRF
jgi:hypothetical protein